MKDGNYLYRFDADRSNFEDEKFIGENRLCGMITILVSGARKISYDRSKVGANPNVMRADGTVLLHIAADSGHTEAAAVLIDGNSDVDETIELAWRCTSFSALMFASRLGNADITLKLLEAGTDMN